MVTIWSFSLLTANSVSAGKMNRQPGRLMMMDKIEWQNGWPVVGVPSDTPRPGPAVRRGWRGWRKQARNIFFSSRPTWRVRRN